MRPALINLIIRVYRFLFARRQFYPLNRLLHGLSLRGLGILNFENDTVSGESHFLKTYLGKRKESIVLDVGANTGKYAEKVLQVQPDARVYSFEPHPLTFKRLQQTALNLGFHAFNEGCGSSRGELILYDYPDKEGSEHATVYEGVFTDIHEQKPVGHPIRVITLDDFGSEHGLAVIDLLKVDVEGNELGVLRGFQDYLHAGRVRAIQFEFNTMNVASRVFFKDFFQLLKGYSFYRMLPNGLVPLSEYDPTLCEIFAFQNIIALRHDLAWQEGGGI